MCGFIELYVSDMNTWSTSFDLSYADGDRLLTFDFLDMDAP